MCGIAGFTGSQNLKMLRDMGDAIKHRGPDGEGTFANHEVNLLNRRLAIVDVEHGQQPYYNEDNSLVVVYNGEIYNHRTLAAKLTRLGHKLNSHCDGEIISHAFEQWGAKCFDQFDGMFAIALYDKKNSRLYLAVDQFAIKPVYYTFNQQKQLLFASEIKPLFGTQGTPAPNETAIYHYLINARKDGNKETFFSGIYKLLPGQIMTYDLRGKSCKVEHYPQASPKKPLTQEALRNLLTKSITDRLMSEVPLGVSISGGVDSTLIAKIAAKNQATNQKLLGFGLVFPGEVNDEEEYIDIAVANEPNINLLKISPQASDFKDDALEFIRTVEEPTIDNSAYSHFTLFREVSKHVTVLLDGQGSDEVFAGYEPYVLIYLAEIVKQRRFMEAISTAWNFRSIILRQLMIFANQKFFANQGTEIFTKSFVQKYHKVTDQPPVVNELSSVLQHDVFNYSLQASLRYLDKNSMHFSVEGRPPFLQKELIRSALMLKPDQLFRSGLLKGFLKDSFVDLLDRRIRTKKKIGFSIPYENWLLKNRIWVIDILQGEKKFMLQFLDKPIFETLLSSPDYYQKINKYLLWRLLNLVLWHKVFFANTAPISTHAK